VTKVLYVEDNDDNVYMLKPEVALIGSGLLGSLEKSLQFAPLPNSSGESRLIQLGLPHAMQAFVGNLIQRKARRALSAGVQTRARPRGSENRAASDPG